MILVTGATGHLGKATLESLLKKNTSTKIAALARDTAKVGIENVDIKVGDYNDYASLVEAFKGVDKLFLVSSNDIGNRTQQQKNAVNAAKEAGVKHIIYTSISYKTLEGIAPLSLVADSHLETEKLIKESGIAYTILRNNLYAEVIPMFIGENVAQDGTVFYPAGDGKTAFVSRQDFAEASATILLQDGHEGKTYDFCGQESYSFQDIANILSDVLGKDIVYAKPSAEEFKATFTQAGVPAEGIHFLSIFAQTIANGEFDITNNTIETLLGRKQTSLKQYLQSVYATVNA